MALPFLHAEKHYAHFELPTGQYRSGIITCDSYARGDNTDLGSTDGIPWRAGRPGIAYSEVAGNWEINGNRIGSTGTTPGGTGWIATIDLGFSDYVFEAMLRYTVTSNNEGLVVGFVDINNFLRVNHITSGIGVTRLTAGSPTTIGSGGAAALPQANDVMRVRKLGAAYTVSVLRAGAQVGASYTVSSETQGQSSSIIGFRASTSAIRWSNLLAMRA